MEQYFAYGDRETDYLRQRDSKLAEAIERLGRPRRRVMPDLFQALTWSILGQQISTKVCEAVWSRMLEGLGEVTPGRVMEESVASLQKFGTSFRKAGYIHSIAEQIVTGAFARPGPDGTPPLPRTPSSRSVSLHFHKIRRKAGILAQLYYICNTNTENHGSRNN